MLPIFEESLRPQLLTLGWQAVGIKLCKSNMMACFLLDRWEIHRLELNDWIHRFVGSCSIGRKTCHLNTMISTTIWKQQHFCLVPSSHVFGCIWTPQGWPFLWLGLPSWLRQVSLNCSPSWQRYPDNCSIHHIGLGSCDWKVGVGVGWVPPWALMIWTGDGLDLKALWLILCEITLFETKQSTCRYTGSSTVPAWGLIASKECVKIKL